MLMASATPVSCGDFFAVPVRLEENILRAHDMRCAHVMRNLVCQALSGVSSLAGPYMHLQYPDCMLVGMQSPTTTA
jgi:hypothetical protein